MFSSHSRRWGVAAVLAMSALPMALTAQRGRGGGPGAGGPNSVSPLIDMRRELDLTPRQVATLDSIERSLDQRNQVVGDRLRLRRDSLLSNRAGRGLSDEDRTRLRARLDSLAPLQREVFRNDSLARSAALRVLTDSQRVRVRELQAERRGFAMGQMMGRGRGMGPNALRQRGGRGFGRRGMGGGRGVGGPRARMGGMGPGGFGQGFGPRMRRGFGGGMGPGGMGRGEFGPGEGGFGPRGMGPGMGGRMGLAPRMRGRMMPPGDGPMPEMNPDTRPNGPDSGMAPRMRGRFGPPGADSTRGDSLPPRRPRRPPTPNE